MSIFLYFAEKSGTELNPNDTKDFPGAISKVYYCDLCDTAFIDEKYVNLHLQDYHRFLKSNEKFIRERKL